MEQSIIDPVQRYQLREQRIADDLNAAANGLVRQAINNGKIIKKLYEEK